ncbi:XRE family transcriptional regulator [Micromonospora vulcania]
MVEVSTALAGERIRAVRRLLGISQIELAEAAGVSQSLISQVENGVKEATDDLLYAVASATNTPKLFFDILPPEIPLGSLRFRKAASARVGDTKRVKALFDEAYRVVSSLFAETHYPLPDLPIAQGDITADDIERLANETREALQIGDDGPIRHLTRSCERAGIAVVPLTLPGSHDASDEIVGHFGISFWPSREEPALVGYFSNGPGDRLRYTLAHELGHLVLHTRRRSAADPEAEANRFAGALLMPQERAKTVFESGLTLKEYARLKAHWGIAIQALVMRAAHLDLISEERKSSLFRQISARGWRKQEPVMVHPEQPMLVNHLMAIKYGNSGTYAKASEKLALGAMVLRSLAPKMAA